MEPDDVLIPNDVTGVLEGWWQEGVSSKECIFWGYIYHDRNGRFPDGTFIHTSGVAYKSLTSKPKEGDIITTRNSKYQLGAEGGLGDKKL